MRLVVQVKLLPSPEQAAALAATLHAVNAAAGRVSGRAYEKRVFSRTTLQQLVYAELKASGLSAQPTLHVIRKVADAYTTLHALIDAGLLGREGSKRRRKVESKPIAFRPDAAHPFDDRCLSWQYDARTVSIWTVHGRVRGIAFTGKPSHLKTLAERRKGESDLVFRDGTWFLLATCDGEEAPLNADPADWIGVDRGIENLATTSDGDNHQGKGLKRYRRAQARRRAELQKKKAAGSRSAARRLAKRKGRESRHATNQNHIISKQIVTDAQRIGRGIAVEQLAGIRDRVRLKRLAGLADDIAAVNVRNRARTAWAFVTMPDPEPRPPGQDRGDATPAPQPVVKRSVTKRDHRASKLGRHSREGDISRPP